MHFFKNKLGGPPLKMYFIGMKKMGYSITCGFYKPSLVLLGGRKKKRKDLLMDKLANSSASGI
jgi:hypothetical protein